MYKDPKTYSESGKRFIEALESRGENFSTLAKKLEITKASTSAWPKSDLKNVGAGNILKACEVLRIRIQWLLNGEGEMNLHSGESWDLRRLAKIVKLLARYERLQKLSSKQKAFILEIFYFDDALVDFKNDKALFFKIDKLAKGSAKNF